MSSEANWGIRKVVVGMVFAAAVGACDSGSSTGTPGGAFTTDQQYCENSCKKLIACGVDYALADCTAACLLSATYRPCLRTVAVDDCNGMALCVFKESSVDFCAGTGMPAGTGTCAQAATCQGECVAANGGAACPCPCNAALAPQKALSLLINDVCSATACAAECTSGTTGAACLVCFAQKCQAQNAQCLAN